MAVVNDNFIISIIKIKKIRLRNFRFNAGDPARDGVFLKYHLRDQY